MSDKNTQKVTLTSNEGTTLEVGQSDGLLADSFPSN